MNDEQVPSTPEVQDLSNLENGCQRNVEKDAPMPRNVDERYKKVAGLVLRSVNRLTI